MQRFFGRRPSSSPSAVPDDKELLNELAESRRMLELRAEHLQRKVESETATAVQAKQVGQKAQALECLKRIKMLKAELDSLSQQRLKLDTQEHTLQQLKFTSMTVGVERKATDAIRAKIAEMNGPDGLEEQKAKTEEALEDAYELLGIAAEPIANPALGGVTDEELLAELEEELEEEQERAERAELLRVDTGSSSGPATAALISMPTPPRTLVTKQQEQEDRELAELDQLAASMKLSVERPMPMLGMARVFEQPKLMLDMARVLDKPMPMLGMAPAVVAM